MGFVAAPRGVLQPGPTRTHVGVELGGTGDLLGIVSARGFSAAAVVRKEEDQRVFGDAEVIERVEQAADVLVHAVDHGGVGLHAEILPLGVDVFVLIPGFGFLVALWNRPLRFHQPHGDLFLEAVFAQDIPAFGEAAFVLGDVFRFGVEGVMRGGVGQVVEKRAAAFGVTADGINGVIGEGVGGVEIVGELGDAFVVVAEGPDFPTFELGVGLVGIEEIAAAVPEAVRLLESSVVWEGSRFAAVVPLPTHARGIAREAEALAEGDHVFREELFLPLAAVAWVEPGEEGSTRRGALGVVVELRELHPLGGEAVDVRRVDLAAVAADVGPAHVVRHDEEDVGWLRGEGGGGQQQDGEKRAHDG